MVSFRKAGRQVSVIAVCTLMLSSIWVGQAGAAPLSPVFMPQPAQVRLTGKVTPLTSFPEVIWAQAPSPLLEKALARFNARLGLIGLGPASPESQRVGLKISVGKDPGYLTLAAREAYTLDVSSNEIVLKADGPTGVLRGLATLLQMIDTRGTIPVLVQGKITDAPRFNWRGLMIDVSRHFLSVDTIERQLDAMELTKLNVLHWHLSDGTGFRVESQKLPRLQQFGAHSQYYTQDQVREVVAYAGDRGIRIVPEFDVPGHTFAILSAYPESAAQPPGSVVKNWERDCKTATGEAEVTTQCKRHPDLNKPAMDPTAPDALRFVRTLFGEMTSLFPDRYVHTGGDEVMSDQWTTNPRIVAYMQTHGFRDTAALQAAFTAEVEKILSSQNKTMMGWDEVGEAPIPKSVVVEAWRGSKWIGSSTRLGHPVVVSAGYYLDLLNPSSTHYAVDPFDTRAVGLAPQPEAKSVGPFVQAFTLDPNAPPLSEAQKKLVLGGEAPLWTELVSDEMVDARLWPRSAAIAERFWSPGAVTDSASLNERLPVVQNMLETFGLKASENQARMIARLTPDNITPLTQFVALTVPVRNYGLNRLADHSGDEILLTPSAIASPDSFEAAEFNAVAARYAAGDQSLKAFLQEKLVRYRTNDLAFQALKGPASIDEVKSLSRQIAELSALGLEALQSGPRGKKWRDRAQALLAEQDKAYAASVDFRASRRLKQPRGGLLIAIVPGIKALVSQAR